MDNERFSAIGHSGLVFWNPVSPMLLDRWIDGLHLTSSSRVLDVGCGRGEFLLRTTERHGCRAIGVDKAESSILAAREAAARRVPGADIELRAEPFDAAEFGTHSLDAAACIGSTHAIADYEQTLRTLSGLVKPGGVVIVGDGYWKQEPPGAYLDFLGCGAGDLDTHAGNMDLARSMSLELIESHETTPEEWSLYEDTYAGNITRYVDANPDDPDVPAMRARIEGWRRAYLEWGHETLGFGLYLFRTREDAGTRR